MLMNASSLRHLTWSLVRGATRYRLMADAELQVLGLSEATALPILFLKRLGDNVRQGTLAAELGVEGPSLSRIVEQLHTQGILDRREDTGDRRARILTLTPKGRALSQSIERALDRFRAELFVGIDAAEISACQAVLDKMSERLRQRGNAP